MSFCVVINFVHMSMGMWDRKNLCYSYTLGELLLVALYLAYLYMWVSIGNCFFDQLLLHVVSFQYA